MLGPDQGFLSRYIISKNLGQNIWTEQMCRQLAADVLKDVKAWGDTKPLRIHTSWYFSSLKGDAVCSIRSLHFDFGGQ